MSIKSVFSIAMGILWLVLVPWAWGDPDKQVRDSPVAGSWYPADPAELTALLDRLLKEAPTTEPAPSAGSIRAILAPHAGYAFSGPVAAAAFKSLEGVHYQRVVVLGPSHYQAIQGMAVPEVTHFRTPLGEIPLDLAAMERLKQNPLVHASASAFAKEHSIDMELPWLQRLLTGEWRLVPLLVGQLDSDSAQALAQTLRPLLDEKTLLVISGDFTLFAGVYCGLSPMMRWESLA